MAKSTLQSAVILPRVTKLPFGEAVAPGSRLTTPSSGSTVDIDGYARRDRELQWRDLVVAKAIEEISRRAATVFGIPMPFPQVPITPGTLVSYDSTLPVTQEADAQIGTSGAAVIIADLAAPVTRGSVQVSVVDESQELTISTSTDDGHRNIIATGQVSDDDRITPPGSIVGGVVNYEAGLITVSIKPYSTGPLQCYVNYNQSATLRASAAIPSEALVYSDLLTFTPVARRTIVITVDGAQVQDDGRGHITASGSITGGTIDYTSGQLELHLKATDADKAITVKYSQQQYLQATAVDLSNTQFQSAPGGITGVRYVSNQSLPQDALVSDQDLYRRDLVLFEVLSMADQVFTSASGWSKALPSPTVPTIDAGGTIQDAWSQAEGNPSYAVPQPGLRWGPEIYGNADRYLAWRDNVLAPYVADLSRKLSFFHQFRSELQAITTEDGRDILLEDELLSVTDQLSGLIWAIDGHNQPHPDPDPVVTVLQGEPNTLYTVTLRIRGFIEVKTYDGATIVPSTGSWCVLGGTPAATSYNIYGLNISDPPQQYYLNNNHFGLSDYTVSPVIWELDYQFTVQMRTGAVLAMTAQQVDNAEHINSTGVITSDPPIRLAQPYYGQFIQMDVVSVTT